MNTDQIFAAFQKSTELLQEAHSLQRNAFIALLEEQSKNNKKTNNLINTLSAPENGDMYTIDELSKVMKLSKSTIYKLCKLNKLPHHKPGSGKLLFYKHQIAEYLNNTHK